MSMKGVYVLVISVDEDIEVDVGALGSISFEKGLYAYVGSAQNSLEKRVERHLGRVKRKFWHIDYLLDNDAVKVVKVFYKEADKAEECKIAGKLGEKGVAVKNFGCSDCGCVSHLFRVDDYGFLRDFMFEMRF
ncbi:MAG: GIY-YIG nuclease family protein [Candidatus Bathyarchaeia archaeon]|nr:GIY-YIG nuclease family protein [Candidatus Bathyarchaeia archaeon]MDI6904058.1 GIY-YIG nuclease family protein [Candidatus Bathyarchaeia archaeon]